MPSSDPQPVDVLVVGAGIVGSSAAHALAERGASVLVAEAAAGWAAGLTGRNSGVVHAGLYYEPGSLKARTSVEGNARLWRWVLEHHVPHRKTGKLVVAQDDAEVCALEALHHNGLRCGVPGLELLDARAAAALEPALPAPHLTLLSPSTGVVDPHALCRSIGREAERLGAVFVFEGAVVGAKPGTEGCEVHTTRGAVLARRVLNAAGLEADRVAALFGASVPEHRFCRGDWFRLRRPGPHRHLIYPVRAPGAPGLGVHLCLELDGGVRVGPDARWVAGRGPLRPPGDEEGLRRAFAAAASRLLGPLGSDELCWDGAALRPKLHGPGEPRADFLVHEEPEGVLHLLGIESPGLTAALALAPIVADRLLFESGFLL